MSMNVMQLYRRAMSMNSLDSRGPPLIMPDEPVKPRIRPDGKPFYEKNRIGSGISSVFQWDVKEDELLPLNTGQRKRLQQKNFVALNKDEVKRIEERMRTFDKKNLDQVKAELAKPLWKSEKLRESKNVEKLHSGPMNGPKADWSNMNGNKEKNVPEEPMTPRTHLKAQNGVQMGQRRLPSQRSKSVEPLRLEDPGQSQGQVIQDRKGSTRLIKHNANHTNGQIAQGSARNQIGNTKDVDHTLKHHAREEVPKYLKERKKAWEREKQACSTSPDAPAGHVLMSQEEKERTLASLKRAEADLLKKFNSLPVRSDTDYLRRKKQELLRKLEEVDEAIKIFSRPKVYVKTDPF